MKNVRVGGVIVNRIFVKGVYPERAQPAFHEVQEQNVSQLSATLNSVREVQMGRRNQILLGGIILGLGIALASPGAAPATEVSELKVTIREWDVPTKGAHPHDPAVGADGTLWFTEQLQNKLGRVDPKTGAFQEYALKIEDSGPHGLVADSSGNIWFTGNAKGYIGKLDPRTGAVAAYKMPDAKADDPHTAVFDSRGILWFTVQVGNMVGRLDPQTGKIDLKKMQTADARPYGIVINSKGIPFFCEFGTNKLAKIDPQSMAIVEYKSGNLGRLDPASGAVKMWPSPGGANSGPYGIAITPDGLVWYSESGVKPNTLIQFNPKTEQFARAAIPSGGGTVRHMVATADGRVYIACSGVNKVGVVEPAR